MRDVVPVLIRSRRSAWLAQTKAQQTRTAVASLTPDERSALAAEFIASTGSTSLYDSEKDKIGTIVETRKYRDFTRERAAGIIAARAA
ncbi:hypothetical protein P3T23_009101 [Paraburkholderia sp. GAS448]|uniref:hypothetical protein n=1 Tax=Paraburkholderia sp. GAS448 TaxID=3035136 RepID=UPI003D1D6A44